MNWFILSLTGETLLDAVMGALGILLIVRGWDNHYKRIWGILILALAIRLLYDNIHVISTLRFDNNLGKEVLSMHMGLEWYFFSHVFTLFTLGLFWPGWVALQRMIVLSVPLILSATVVGCYWWFGGEETVIPKIGDIFANLGNTDVQIRAGLFLLSLINPTIYILLPLLWRKAPLRKLSRGAYIYVLSAGLLNVAYVIYTLNLYDWIFFAYGYVISGVMTLLTFLYLHYENPFSLPPKATSNTSDPLSNSEELVSPIIYLLHQRMVEFMKTETPFANPEYTPSELARELNTNQRLLLQAIKYGGYTSFREYINVLRLQHFKRIASELPGASVKELMYRSGFTSRSSFYRHFSEQEAMSPKQYLEILYSTSGSVMPDDDPDDDK